MLIHFRDRIGAELINKINSDTVKTQSEQKEDQGKKTTKLEEIKKSKNSGKLIIDATYASGDISYPKNLNLLSQGRIKTEKIIDTLYEPIKSIFPKKNNYLPSNREKRILKGSPKKRGLFIWFFFAEKTVFTVSFITSTSKGFPICSANPK
ncbi:MAG: hypothetical protein O4805_05480 [Trichodesmium sp. St16_bin2-tuft]|nr:hypothetical protein [Trichodesmium sp. St5_bin2_1]MDE5084667.1 hypothetical protein [Trichodesmium sp. St18_bin1]MDE5086621.1 hypothetical protein [Trichodesmium sp. St16_bin2-tuft]MDE5117146.1 hypothetical protein [Trichodesmium sp. St2_bin2_1]MDE5123440.1 hypothetical protein [Trichodesmium sp. St19_bin1]